MFVKMNLRKFQDTECTYWLGQTQVTVQFWVWSVLKRVTLTNSHCCKTLDDSLGWITTWIKRSWCIFCKAETDDCKWGGFCDQQARPRKQKCRNWAKCLHEVRIFSPRLCDHCTKLSKTKCTWRTRKAGLVHTLLNPGLPEQMISF